MSAESVTAHRIEMFAAKWLAEHQHAEPPRHAEPTDDALRACFAHCGRPIRPELYPAVRAAIAADDGT